MENTNIIQLKDIAMSFDGEQVLSRLNLSISDGEFVTLLGPSGCGKTTTLRIIGGFITPDSGDVFFEGKRINQLPPHKRAVNTIFQRYALFPHLNVYENVAFGMRVQKKSNAEIKDTVARMLKLVNLVGFEKRGVQTLSGGQQQRVAIARALANHPKVLLLDEPLGGVDPAARDYILNTILRNYSENASVVLSTHLIGDIERVLDEVLMLKDNTVFLHQSVDELREEHGCSVDEYFREVFRA